MTARSVIKMPTKKHKTLVFVCTGNYYRSRFSEYLFNAFAEQAGLRWRATSRGLKSWLAVNEGPLSEFAAYRLTTLGIPYDADRFPMQLTEADLEAADFVVAMKRSEHLAMMVEQFPEWADRVQYWHIDDLDCASADESLPTCESCVKFLVETLLAEQKRQEMPLRLRRA